MKVFRDLYVEVLDNVSILFADIVGFTNMSSGKTAEELLDLLNDLYGRFDRLAEETGCEKIATLGGLLWSMILTNLVLQIFNYLHFTFRVKTF